MIPPQQGRARPREFCEKCRPPRNRGNPRVIQLHEAKPKAAPKRQSQRTSTTTNTEPLYAPSSLVDSYRQKLESVGRLDCPEGALVMELAQMMTAGRGNHTAAGAASLSRELRAAMEAAMADARPEADVIDHIFGAG